MHLERLHRLREELDDVLERLHHLRGLAARDALLVHGVRRAEDAGGELSLDRGGAVSLLEASKAEMQKEARSP